MTEIEKTHRRAYVRFMLNEKKTYIEKMKKELERSGSSGPESPRYYAYYQICDAIDNVIARVDPENVIMDLLQAEREQRLNNWFKTGKGLSGWI